MLDTLLQIGKILRESGRLRHHRYIRRAPKVEETKIGAIKTDVVYLNLPVREDFTFDFDNLDDNFRNENIISDFYYLAYKSSDSDSLVKYVWGDISYGVDKKGDEQGYYRMENSEVKNAFGLSSFTRGIEDAKTFNGTSIEKFRESFIENQEQIENLLKEYGKERYCYLHFDFQGERKHWYQFEDELKRANEKMLSEFLDSQNGQYVLQKYLCKTLRAFNEKDAIFQIPGITKGKEYKAKSFKAIEEVLDLFYAIDFSQKYQINIENIIKINILPKGKNLEANHIGEFFAEKGLGNYVKAVGVVDANNQSEEFFSPFTMDTAKNFTQFDVIFSDVTGKKDVDIIELASLERDLLVELDERVRNIRIEVENDRKNLFEGNSNLLPLGLRQSYSNILSGFTKKFTNHLLKVLPQIYTGTYYRDEILLPAFIEKVQCDTRNYDNAKSKGNRPFNFLKFDYEFLVKLRNPFGNTIGEEEMTKMKEDINYKIGLLLGHLAQPVSRDINSFEKGYVGLLLRHISDLKGLVKFTNFINSKLAIHGRVANKVRKRSNELENIIGKVDLESLPNFAALSLKVDSMINEINERNYNIEFCAFGFFEGYFSKYLKSQEESSTEGENQ